jgi:hypothetical protein
MRPVLMLLASMALASAQAQQSPGAAQPARPRAVAPSPDQLEPAVDTTAATTPAPASAPAAAPARGVTPKSDSRTAADKKGPKGPDRVELETTEITGNRELPKVLYIVPWKRSDLGDLVGKPANSLLDEVLQPIDRDVFLRENRYYEALKPDTAGVKAGTVPGSGAKP